MTPTGSPRSVRHESTARLHIVLCVPVLDRRKMCPVPMKEIGQKGTAKLCQVPLTGCHKQSGLKCTGRRPSPSGRATTGCMARQRSMRLKPLYLAINLIISVMAFEAYGEIRADLTFLPDRHE